LLIDRRELAGTISEVDAYNRCGWRKSRFAR
jgi:hypothetical protein